MKETQRNIRTYKKKLIGLKEKLATAGLLFLMSAVMLTTASFAWVTLSTAPEVSNISTTIAGNGNLEIALASSGEKGMVLEPEASKVGDGNKELTLKNLTWGNLVNLNDQSYGLANIILRPAILNSSNLLTNPLSAVQYSEDGRITTLDFDFAFSNYDSVEQAFVIPNVNAGEYANYGVRAISSVIKSISGGSANEDMVLYEEIKNSLDFGKSSYGGLVGSESNLKTIAGIMGDYMTWRLNSREVPANKYLEPTLEMLKEFLLCLDSIGEFYVKSANAQILKSKLDLPYYSDFSSIKGKTAQQLSDLGITIFTDFKFPANTVLKEPECYAYDKFISIYNGTLDCIDSISQHIDSVKADSNLIINLSSISSEINFLVDVDTCLINNSFLIKDMANHETELANMVMFQSNTRFPGLVQGGALHDFEVLTGQLMNANVSVTATYDKMNMSPSLKANVKTAASNMESPFILEAMLNGSATAKNSVSNIIFGTKTFIETAGDVYGMAIDFWVKTNAKDSYLTLEGKPDIQYSVLTNLEECACYTDPEGTIYYFKPANGCVVGKYDGIDPRYDTPNISELENGSFYYYSSNLPKTFDEKPEGATDEQIKEAGLILLEDFLPTLSYAQKTVVVGYDGTNRIWQTDSGLIDADSSTTQGLGSCFIFYPDNPMEQKQMLELMSALSVAFIDGSGTLLATAVLDSKTAYEEGGKITVPLKLTYGIVNPQATDTENNLAITALAQNENTMITAIVYLDGGFVENHNVNADTNINGSLNLQFGSSELLSSMRDKDLEAQVINLSAGIRETGNNSDYTVTLDFGENAVLPKSVDVNVAISGVNPGEVKANFVRKVNNFQGEKMSEMLLTSASNGEWNGTYTFTVPGTYILNRVWIDGIEYELKQPLSVTVGSFSITDIDWDGADEIYVMTSDNYYDVEVAADINTSDYYSIKTAQALFRNESNEYLRINLSLNSFGKWEGRSRFTTSGRYVLEYILIDDNVYCAVPESQMKIANISLGINASVDLARESFTWVAEEPNDTSNTVGIKSVKILDNKGKELDQMNDLVIRYDLAASDNYVESALVWDSTTKSYHGEFNILYPGIYSFTYIEIGKTSKVDKATAETITAIPPFEPEAISESLTGDKYQFAPKNDGGFIFAIKDSSTARVAAKLEFTNPKNNVTSEYVMPAALYSSDSTTRITQWKIAPFNPDLNQQDGIWTLKEIYLTDVFYNGNWNSVSGDIWWESEQPFVIWTTDMFTSDTNKLTINILNQINVDLKSSYSKPETLFSYDSQSKTVKYTSDFTESLSGKFVLSDFEISYTDIFGLALDTKNYDLAIIDSLSFDYQPNTQNPEVNGWWKAKGNTTITQSVLIGDISNQKVTFDSDSETVNLMYPGIYTPSLNITIECNGEKYTNTSNDSSASCFNITQSLNQAIVLWNRPVVKYTGINPTGQVTVSTEDNSSGKATNKWTETSIEVYMSYTAGGTCSSEKWAATKASAALTNYGSTTSASASAKKADGTKTFEFNFSNGVHNDVKIGSDGTSRNPIGSEVSTISEVVITYNGTTYTFELETPLTAVGPY